jgi:DNA mismatch repair ATPase MutS
MIGARAIYATHLHELAAGAEELNASTPGDSHITSMVASLVNESSAEGGDIKRTYRVIFSPPMGRSYAHEIAARYGISYEQLIEMLDQRGVIPK